MIHCDVVEFLYVYFTVMLTHGFINCCLIVALMPKSYSDDGKGIE